jgi:hypothetical protein
MTCTRRLAAMAVAALVFVAACGHDTAMPEDVSSPLRAQVDRIEQSASTGDMAGARERAGELRSLVLELRAGGRLDTATADRVLAKVSVLETALDAMPASDTATAAATTTPPTSTTSAPAATTTTKPSPVTTPTKKPKPGKGKQDE